MVKSTGLGAERRKEPRYAASCRCWIEQDSLTLLGTATNLSYGGMFLRTLPLIREGAEIDVKLTLDLGVVTAKGQVRWASRPDRAARKLMSAPGLGICFLEVLGGQDLLTRFVQRLALSEKK